MQVLILTIHLQPFTFSHLHFQGNTGITDNFHPSFKTNRESTRGFTWLCCLVKAQEQPKGIRELPSVFHVPQRSLCFLALDLCSSGTESTTNPTSFIEVAPQKPKSLNFHNHSRVCAPVTGGWSGEIYGEPISKPLFWKQTVCIAASQETVFTIHEHSYSNTPTPTARRRRNTCQQTISTFHHG